MSAHQKLKPCPICGETPQEIFDATKFRGVFGLIHRCPVWPAITIEAYTEDDVAKMWNTRALTEAS